MRNKNLTYKQFSFPQLGFTLIELIVSFSILSILSVVGIASFVNYSRSQALFSDRQKLITVLNSAKANSSSQLKNSDCQSTPSNVNEALNGYSVTIKNDEQYTLNIECINTGNQQPHPIDYWLSTNNITFDLSLPSRKIFFPLFTGGAVVTDRFGNSVSDPAQIIIKGYGKQSIITIYKTGIIK